MEQHLQEHIHLLLERIQSRQATAAECDELLQLIDAEHFMGVVQLVTAYHQSLLPSQQTDDYDPAQWQPMINSILQVDKTKAALIFDSKLPVQRVHWLRNRFTRYAAIIALTLGVIAYLWTAQRQKNPTLVEEDRPMQKDIGPGGNKAMLILSDGSNVILDSTSNGIIAQQGNAAIVQLSDGQIAYQPKGQPAGSNLFNTMQTPWGGQYQLTLADGTKVWLNATSSIKYPVAFAGKERRVEITGEVYFEVAKDPAKQFIVQAGSLQTTVLGTHFNINTYEDEAIRKITLLEGKVSIADGIRNLVLQPGQQAQAGNNKLSLFMQPDLEEVMAWKDGKFRFTAASIDEVMLQFKRWYNIEIVYKDKPAKTFDGSMPRSLTVLNALKILEATGGVRFKLEGNKVIVMK